MAKRFENPYEEGISFEKLARDDPEFAKVLLPSSTLDFNDPASVVQLTKSLLKRDFNLTISLPPDRLCPPVPNRLNYLLYIRSLLESSTPVSIPRSNSLTLEPKGLGSQRNAADTSAATEQDVPPSPTPSSAPPPNQPPLPITGLDIGTGASAIYPLLATRVFPHPNSQFHATDIDPLSLSYARQNIESNGLQSRIHLHKTDVDGKLLPLDDWGVEELDFVMCNPPFYASQEELEDSAKAKSKPPNSVCAGSANEMVTEGGEVVFVSKILSESLVLRERVRWYTSMLGKLSSLPPLIEKLRAVGCTNWVVTELLQGSGKDKGKGTRRWVLGWSWGDWRASMQVARGVGAGLEKKYLPFPSEYLITLEGKDKNEVVERVDTTMSLLALSHWWWDEEKPFGTGFARGNVWGRRERRKKRDIEGKEKAEEPEDEMAFGFSITVDEKEGKVEVKIRWLKGFDSVIFESFCGMVKRKLEQ